MGVITIKKIKNITKGAEINPRISPNLIQILFNGLRKLAFIEAEIKNKNDNVIDHNLRFSELIKGQIPIIKKIIKNKNPKLLPEFFFVFILNDINKNNPIELV